MKNGILFVLFLNFAASFGAGFFGLPEAYANLGGTDASVENDALIARSKHTTLQKNLYLRHELSQHKSVIHEFSKSSNKIFAVAWRGSATPNLQTLLGNYYSEFQSNFAKAKKNHHHGGVISVDSENLHVEIGGRMMSMYGQVWLTKELPEGMDLHEIQ